MRRVGATGAADLLDGVLDLVFPKRCVRCRASGSWLCEPCTLALQALPTDRCPRCGAPRSRAAATATWRASDVASEARRSLAPCRECRGRELAFLSASAAFVYEGPARALVTACKFRALRSLVDEMARLAGPAFVAACSAAPDRIARGSASAPLLVTWIPAHRDHTLERGFNQAELLARGFARSAGVPSAPLLRRRRHGARQSGLDRAARAANVRDAFALREDANGVLRRFKRVMLIDDVYTTGETVDHGAEVLARAGCRPQVFTFARTVRGIPTQASLDNAVQKERCR
jgi:predicted amidophosphoribosyltransferase